MQSLKALQKMMRTHIDLNSPRFEELQKCRDLGSNRGPSDLQSDALPTDLSRQLYSKMLFFSSTACITQSMRPIVFRVSLHLGYTGFYMLSDCQHRLLGLVVWFSLRVREVPGAIPGAALLNGVEEFWYTPEHLMQAIQVQIQEHEQCSGKEHYSTQWTITPRQHQRS